MVIDAVLTPADIALLPERDLSHAACVVFDVLRATSSMLTGLANGVAEIWPVASIDEALALKQQMPAAVLGGERNGDAIEGFDIGNSPLEYTGLKDRTIITTTTNGTIALNACARAKHVYIGALLNIAALRAEITRLSPGRVLLICAGTFDTFAFEDAVAAGALIGLFPNAELTDAARACLAVARSVNSPLAGLLASRNGRSLAARGWATQVEWCAQVSRFDAIGVMGGGVIRPL